MSALSTRLVRLLNMVPYFQANPRITRAEAAAELGVTAKQLEEDLNQLWMCGLPGYSRVTSSTSNSAVTPSR